VEVVRVKNLLFLLTFISLIVFPLTGHPQGPPPFLQEGWYAETNAIVDDRTNHYEDPQSDYNPSAPNVSSLSNLDYPPQSASATAWISESQGYLNAIVDNGLSDPSTYSYASSLARYYDIYTATAPLLIIDYSYTYDIFAQGRASDAVAGNYVDFSIIVQDQTTMEYLFPVPFNPEVPYIFYDDVFVSGADSSSKSGSGADTLYISTPVGHDISVYVSAEEWANAYGDAKAGSTSFSANVDITVVPEPISAVLFITGGVILGFRRFYNK